VYFEEKGTMAEDSLHTTLTNIDVRLTRVEQILPGLATREELHAAIAPLATREELHAAIAPLATREEMHAAIAVAVAPLATREELHAAIAAAVAPLATREEMYSAIAAAVAPLATREEMSGLSVRLEQDRHRWTMLFDDLRDDNRIILEHLLALSARVDALARR